jgi:hypothetical protein
MVAAMKSPGSKANRVRAQAHEVLAASSELLREYEGRRRIYRQWESEALALVEQMMHVRQIGAMGAVAIPPSAA